jgi:DNA mismatch repair ATPase MutL
MVLGLLATIGQYVEHEATLVKVKALISDSFGKNIEQRLAKAIIANIGTFYASVKPPNETNGTEQEKSNSNEEANNDTERDKSSSEEQKTPSQADDEEEKEQEKSNSNEEANNDTEREKSSSKEQKPPSQADDKVEEEKEEEELNNLSLGLDKVVLGYMLFQVEKLMDGQGGKKKDEVLNHGYSIEGTIRTEHIFGSRAPSKDHRSSVRLPYLRIMEEVDYSPRVITSQRNMNSFVQDYLGNNFKGLRLPKNERDIFMVFERDGQLYATLRKSDLPEEYIGSSESENQEPDDDPDGLNEEVQSSDSTDDEEE